jgi:hypothetical protein
MTKEIFMTTHQFCEIDGLAQMLWAGQYYKLSAKDADVFLENNCAIEVKNEQHERVISDSTSRRSNNRGRGKRISKGGRNRR